MKPLKTDLSIYRNAIAHKKKASATGSEASSAIGVALELKELLHNLK